MCGNGTLEAGEECDGTQRVATFCAAKTGHADAHFDGTPTCTACKLNATECVSCFDGKKNGSEADIDCGGGATGCTPCDLGRSCDRSAADPNEDCASGSCLVNVCSPSFTPVPLSNVATINAPTSLTSLRLARLRAGAPYDDLLAYDASSSSIVLFESDTSGNLGAPKPVITGLTPGMTFKPVQLGPDLVMDLVVLNPSNTGLGVAIYYGAANGTFTKPDPTYLSGTKIVDVAVGRFDADALVDLAIVTEATRMVYKRGTGTLFTQLTAPETLTGTPTGVAFADIGRDGDLDVLTAQKGLGGFNTLISTGDGGTEGSGTINPTSSGNAAGLFVGRLRAPAAGLDPDVATPLASPDAQGKTIRLFANKDGGVNTFAFSPFMLATKTSAPSIVGDDFDRRHGTDLLAYGPSATAELLANEGNGTFRAFDLPLSATQLTTGNIRGNDSPDIVHVDATGKLVIHRNDAHD